MPQDQFDATSCLVNRQLARRDISPQMCYTTVSPLSRAALAALLFVSKAWPHHRRESLVCRQSSSKIALDFGKTARLFRSRR